MLTQMLLTEIVDSVDTRIKSGGTKGFPLLSASSTIVNNALPQFSSIVFIIVSIKMTITRTMKLKERFQNAKRASVQHWVRING